MDNVINQPSRMHPMMVAAAASVTLVSLLGVAAITGLIPTSHGTAVPPTGSVANLASPVRVAEQSSGLTSNERYISVDGKVLKEVPVQRIQAGSVTRVFDQALSPAVVHQAPVMRHTPVVHHAPVRHYHDTYAQNTYSEPVNSDQQRPYQQQYQTQYEPQHPVVNYVNDMHPVGTGVGALLGGLLGNQVGGGNGKKLATVAGVLMGGYAGNEIAHNRSPLPGQ